MLVYLTQLIKVAMEANPFERRDIGLAAIVFIACETGLGSYIDLYAPDPDVAPVGYLGSAAVLIVIAGATFHLLGIQFELPGDSDFIRRRLRRTGFVFTRCNLFLVLNFFVFLVPLYQLAEPAIAGMLGQSDAEEGSLAEYVTWTLAGIPVFGLVCLLWFLFPRWFFNSMPFVYNSRAFVNETKLGLRKVVLPTIVAFLAIDFLTTAMDFGIEALLDSTEALHTVTENFLFAITFYVFLFGCVAAMVSAARLSGLSKTVGLTFEAPQVTQENIDVATTVTGNSSGWKIIPYTDGNFVYYPNTRWNAGYVLSKAEAAELLDAMEKKGLSFGKFAVIGGVLGGIGAVAGMVVTSFMTINPVSVLLIACFTVAIVTMTDIQLRNKKFIKKHPSAPVCLHPFPNHYARLKLLTIPIFSLPMLCVFSVFMSLMTAFFVYVMFAGNIKVSILGLMIPLTAVFAATAGIYIWFLFWRLRFGHIHGRKPLPEDLGPIDPETGKMERDPFTRTSN